MDETRRRSTLRLPGYDYTQAGGYFVTACTKGERCLLGSVAGDQVVLSTAGHVTRQTWLMIPNWFGGVTLDEFAVMPNHVHGILMLTRAKHGFAPTSNRGRSPSGTTPGSLSTIVQAYKSCVTRTLNRATACPQPSFWQRGFYDHVIRDEEGLATIREYIRNNPLQWHLDRENPNRTGEASFYQWLETLGRGEAKLRPSG